MIQDREKIIKQKQVKISAIVPVYNEQQGIDNFLTALVEQLDVFTDNYQVIVVDDGSIDETFSVVEGVHQQNNRVKLISFSRNFGKETALAAGLEYVADSDIAILIDSDFQHPIELLPTFLQHWENGADMVYGVQANRDHESWVKKSLTKYFYQVMEKITQVKLTPNAGDFRLLDRTVVDALNACHERSRFMKGLYAWVGFNSIGVEFSPAQRKQGASSWSLWKLLELALTGITSFSNVPLRIWSLLGLTISLCSILYAFLLLSKTLVFGIDLPGYASLMVAVLFLGGVQLFSIGILGEYVARIFNEVKQRPKYIVDKTIGI